MRHVDSRSLALAEWAEGCERGFSGFPLFAAPSAGRRGYGLAGLIDVVDLRAGAVECECGETPFLFIAEVHAGFVAFLFDAWDIRAELLDDAGAENSVGDCGVSQAVMT